MLRTPGLLALFTAKLLSTFGSWLTLLALPWFVLATTGSPVKMSLVLTTEFAGVVIVGLASGTMVAKLGARRTMLIGDAARAPLMASIPLLHLTGALNLPILLAVSFGLGAFTTPYVSSQRLILPELLGPVRGTDETLVGRANSLIDAATRIAALAGPALGGLLIALLGPAEVLWIDAGTYLVSFLIVLAFVRPPANGPATGPEKHPAKGSGYRQILGDPTLRLFGVALLLMMTLAIPAIFLCLPVVVLHDLGGDPRTLGLLTAANGAGLALGSLVAVTALNRLGTTALTAAAALLCVPLWLLLVERPIVVAMGLFLTGLATPVFAATIITRFTLCTPPHQRPHVLATVTNTENLSGFIGSIAAGPALQFAGSRPVFATIAVLAGAGATMFALGLRVTPEHLPWSTGLGAQSPNYSGMHPTLVASLWRACLTAAAMPRPGPTGTPPPPPSVRRVTSWICRHPDNQAADDIPALAGILQRCPELRIAHQLVREFATMLTHRTGATTLNGLIAEAAAADPPAISTFAQHLTADLDAVTAGLTLHWNSRLSRATSTGSKCLNDRRMAAPASTCSTSESCSPSTGLTGADQRRRRCS